MFTMDMKIAGFDDELNEAMKKEIKRQEEHVELIASENYASPRVLEAQGSLMTNKYWFWNSIMGMSTKYDVYP